MMNKSTQTLLTELRKKQVSVATVASYLDMDDNVRTYGLESFVGLLVEHNEEFLSEDLVRHLIDVIEKSIEEKRLEEEEEMNKLILSSSYTHYHEVLSLIPNLDGKLSYVSEYKGKESTDNLEYYVFAPKLGVSTFSFTINNLIFTVSPVEPISFKNKTGETKQVSYKYSIRIIHKSQRTMVNNDFDQFKVDVLYFALGMSYLPGSNMVKTNIESDVITLNIDTYPFHSELAKKYNSYYSNIVTSNDVKLSEISGIEKCQFDISGAILVPKLFYYSTLILDSDISSRPFIWDNNQGYDAIPLKQNSYRITMNVSKSVAENDVNFATSKIIELFEAHGIQLKSSGYSVGNGNVNNVNFQIVNYDTFGPDFVSGISHNLLAERQVSEIFKMGVLHGYFSLPDYHVKSNTISPDTEKYSFVVEGDSLNASYVKTDNKYMIFFNRSSYTIKNSSSNDSSDLIKLINDTNTQKFNVNGQMLDHYSVSNMKYNGKTYQDTYSNYIPTSIIPVLYKKTEGRDANRKTFDCTGVSFLPFGFAKYTTSDTNRALCLTGYAVYGSSFSFEPATVYRVLNLSNDPSDIQNIVQIVIQSEIDPQFDESMDLPIRVQRLNSSYFTALFRSSGYNFKILTPSEWFYASDYSIDKDIKTEDVSFTRKVFIDIQSPSTPQLYSSSLLRFYLETLAFSGEFKKSFIMNWSKFLPEDKPIALSEVFRQFFGKGGIEISGVPTQFFDLVANICQKGFPNDNIFDIVQKMTLPLLKNLDGNFSKTFEMVKFLIKSVSKPVSEISFPIYTNDIHSSIMLKTRTEVNDVHGKIQILMPELVNRTASEIKTFANKYSGLLRTAIVMIAEIYEETPKYTMTQSVDIDDLVTLEKLVYSRLIEETESSTLETLVGSQITPTFIETIASELSPELFIRVIDQVQKLISNDDTEMQIREVLSKYLLDMNVISITQVSNSMYALSYDSQYEEAVQVLNGYYIMKSDRTLYLSESESQRTKFANTKYDPNVHCMFSVSHPDMKNSDAIMLGFSSGNICYTRIGDRKVIDTLSIVSIYQTEENTTKFFIPFTYNNGKLTVNAVKFTVGECVFTLDSEICEVEVTSMKSVDQEKLKLISRLAICSNVLNATTNYQFMKSLILAGSQIEKPYVVDRKMYHYVFTSDIKEEFESGEYNIDDYDVYVALYPSTTVLAKYQMKKSILAIDIFEFFGTRYSKSLKMKKSDFTAEYKNVLDNHLSYFENKYSKSDSSSDEVLVVSTSNRIYTKYYGNRLLESTIASGNQEYHNYISEINFEKDEELSSIDKIMLDEAIETENKLRSQNNSIYNLSLAMSSLKWDEVHIDNYHFYSDEKPKWVKFSTDSNYMGIGFRSGVKIYIKVGSKYLFCTNLHHEDVSNIHFGNKEFCVTTQYEDTEREFAILWVTTAGIPMKLKIPFYTPVEGDAVNIKYITGNSTKEKKNVILEMDGEKMKYGAFVVQYAEPIFNHNVYFFSENDRYLVYNRLGSFRVYDLQNMKFVTFNTLNGATIIKGTVLPKCIEDGTWLSDHTFVGFTYVPKNPQLKLKITLDLVNLSIHVDSTLSEFPSSTLYEKMTNDSSVKIHKLYSYLMNKKAEHDKQSAYIVGSWIYDCFISIVKINDRYVLRISSIHGSSTENLIDTIDETYHHGDIVNMFNNMVTLFEFSVDDEENGKVISSISNVSGIIYSKGFSSERQSLQYIEKTFYSFIDTSIFVWEYRKNSTEIIHINPHGYERMIFRGHLIVFTTDSIRVGFVDDRYLSLNPLEITNYFDSSKRAVNVSSIVRSVDETYETEVIAYTETSIERYNSSNENMIPIIVDSKPISASLCLNRYQDYTLRSHANTANELSHGNLLVIVKGRHVKIIPKTIQIPKKVDGYNMAWYAKHQSQDWQAYEDEYNSYIAVTEQLLPCFAPSLNNGVDYDYLANIFRNRNSQNFMSGVDKLREDKISENLINAIIKAFEVFQDASVIYSKSLLIEKFRQYEKDEIASDNGIRRYLGSSKDPSFNQKFDDLIDSLEPLIGKSVMKSSGIEAFAMIRELQYHTVNGRTVGRTIDQIREIINSQKSTTDRIREIKQIINHILSIPLSDIQPPKISKPDLFRSRYSNVRDDIKKMREMKSKNSKYDLYRAMESDRLHEKFTNFANRYFALNAKTNQLNQHPDYIYAMMYEGERVNLPKNLKFVNNLAEDQTHIYQIYEMNGEMRCIRFLKKSLEIVNMYNAYQLLLIPLFKHLEENIEIVNKIPSFYDMAKICGCIQLKKDENDYTSKIVKFRDTFLKISEVHDLPVDTVKNFILDFGSLCNHMNRNGIKSVTFVDLEVLIQQLNTIRFPFPTHEYGDITNRQEIIATYNLELHEETEPELLQWNLPYIKKEYKLTYDFTVRKYSVNSRTYDETYEGIRQRLVPLLNLYRNGVCEDTEVPVTSINLIFPRDVKFVKKSDFNQSELSELEFEYKIPDDRVSYDIEYGKVSVSLVDIIMKFDPRTSENQHEIMRVHKMIDDLKRHDILYGNGDGIKVLQKVIPPFAGSNKITNFDEFKRTYDFVYGYAVYKNGVLVVNPEVEQYKKIKSSHPQFSILDLEIDYKGDYITSGIELNGVEYPLLYGNRINIEKLGSMNRNPNISLGCVKPIDFMTRQVTRDGMIPMFTTDKSSYLLYFGNTIKDSQSIGYLITQDIQTRETQVYHYVKKDKNQDVMTYIIDLKVDENEEFEMRESVYDSKFEKGKGFVDVIVEKVRKISGFQSLINEMQPVEGLTSKKYEESIIERTLVKTCENLYATSVTYRSGAHYGSIVEVFTRSEKGSYERINSWNFHMFNVQDFDLTSSDVYLLGTSNGVGNSSIVQIGTMSINSGKSDGSKPVFVKTFDRKINISNSNIQGFYNPKVIAGKTTYITFGSKNLSHLIILNKKSSYESFNIHPLTSIHVSRECGFAALYYKNLHVTEIWNCNGKLTETIEGECNWM